MSFVLLRNYAKMVLEYWAGRPPIFSPMLTSVYLTHRCNLNCVYCDDGSGNSFPEHLLPELDTAGIVEILRIVRKDHDVISFTGGEPSVRDDIVEILAAARKLGFKDIMLNTNAVLAREKSGMFDYVDTVMVSFDSLNEEFSDRLWRAPAGTTATVRKNIEWLSGLRREKKFKLAVNTVIVPENIAGVYEVMDFCLSRGITFIPGPAMDRFYPFPSLAGNPAYIRLMNRIIEAKKNGDDILGTVQCFTHERDFSKFDCVPLTVARIQPNGDVLFPCNRLRQIGGNILETGSLKEAIRIGYKRHGYPRCDNRCHLICYLDLSLIVRNPLLCLFDGFHRARGFFGGAGRSAGRSAGRPPHSQ